MKHLTVTFQKLLILAPVVGSLMAVAADKGLSAFSGTWKENQSKTVNKPGFDVMEIKVNPDGTMTQISGLGDAKNQYTFRIDGKPYSKGGSRSSWVWTAVGSSEWKIISSKDGKVVSMEQLSISPDGRILTNTSHKEGACTGPAQTVTYERTSKEKGGIGAVWKAVSFKTQVPDVFRIETPADGTLTWHELSPEYQFNARPDGKQYPVTGACASPGMMTASILVKNDHTLEITSRRKGKAFQVDTWELSADGRTIINDAREPSTNVPLYRMIYDRQ